MSSENIETRTRILTEAINRLEEQGGRGVRMADIAKSAGISRQAVYLHFASRAELLEATTKYLDQKLDLDARLAPSRAAQSGTERLALYVDFWGNYIPEIYGVAKALLIAQHTEPAAAEAWRERMAAMREGCYAAISALSSEGNLATEWTKNSATDALWAMLSVENWEHLTIECEWSKKHYIARMKALTKRAFVKS